MDLSVLLLIPSRQLNPDKVKKALVAYSKQRESSIDLHSELLVLTIPRSRCLWQVLAPLFLSAEKESARRAVVCVLQNWEPWSRRVSLPHGDCSFVHPSDSNSSPARWAQKRSLKTSRQHNQVRKSPHYFLWIEPSSFVQHEDSFTGRLLAWEHKLIRAQSLTGYIATLGGGFFLCHHFQTAIALAQQQQQLALFLNDHGMYYRCMINTAYSWVYAGKFQKARQFIQHVCLQAKLLYPPDPVLEKMCGSALLFCKRVKQASKRLRQQTATRSPTDVESTLSRTIDDFARIRVVADQSLHNDLNIPFNGEFRHVKEYIHT